MNILIVDDEAIVLEGVERMLSTLGADTWKITCATSGASALDVMATTEVDLIITDMRMPKMDGAQLLAETAARWPRIARFALSAEACELQAVRAAGVAHQFLSKPCRAQTMLAALRSIEALSTEPDADAVRALVSAVPRLPALPMAFARLRAALADPQSDARCVTEIVRQDPGTAAKVIQLANSSFFFRGSAVADMYAAVLRLGTRLISRLVLVEGLLADMPSTDRFDYAREARQFFQAALLAEATVSPAARDEASLAVLLSPIGRSVMIAADPDRVAHAMAIAAAEGIPLVAAERRVFGTSHAAVGGHLVALWGLPPRVTSAIACQYDQATYRSGDEILAAVFLANRDVRGVELERTTVDAPGTAALVAAWDRHKARIGDAP